MSDFDAIQLSIVIVFVILIVFQKEIKPKLVFSSRPKTSRMSDVASTVVVRLDASLSLVRQNALCALDKLEPAALAQYADAIVTKLEEIAELALDPPRARSCA